MRLRFAILSCETIDQGQGRFSSLRIKSTQASYCARRRVGYERFLLLNPSYNSHGLAPPGSNAPIAVCFSLALLELDNWNQFSSIARVNWEGVLWWISPTDKIVLKNDHRRHDKQLSVDSFACLCVMIMYCYLFDICGLIFWFLGQTIVDELCIHLFYFEKQKHFRIIKTYWYQATVHNTLLSNARLILVVDAWILSSIVCVSSGEPMSSSTL